MEEINLMQGIMFAAITAAVCVSGYIAGTKKRLTNEGRDDQENRGDN